MTDNDFLLSLLKDRAGEWVSHAEVLRRSEQARGCGMTVHSRISDLRARGLTIENRVERKDGKRAVSFYRLLPTPEVPIPSPGRPASGAESSHDETLFPTLPVRELWA